MKKKLTVGMAQEIAKGEAKDQVILCSREIVNLAMMGAALSNQAGQAVIADPQTIAKAMDDLMEAIAYHDELVSPEV